MQLFLYYGSIFELFFLSAVCFHLQVSTSIVAFWLWVTSLVLWVMKARKMLLFLTETLNSPACFKVSFDPDLFKLFSGH